MIDTKPEIDRIAPTLEPSGRVVMHQQWRDLLFLHWDIAPETVEKMLPPGLRVDTFRGRAYIGLVPFTMQNVCPAGLPAVPWLSNFHECNVRTYVVSEKDNVPGVWFWSLDAANPVAVAIARGIWKLPYFRAQITLSRQKSGAIDYLCRRTGPEPLPADCHISYTPTGAITEAEPGTLEHFLTERYVLYAYASGKLLRGRVHHSPYPLQTARVETLSDTLMHAAGFVGLPKESPPLIHYAGGVDVRVWAIHAV